MLVFTLCNYNIIFLISQLITIFNLNIELLFLIFNFDITCMYLSYFLLGRFIFAEDAAAVHLSNSISHKHSLPLEACGSSFAFTLHIGEDRHHIPSFHVYRHRQVSLLLFIASHIGGLPINKKCV